MKSVVIVECTSSSVGYVEEIRKHGYIPIIIEVKIENPDAEAGFRRFRDQCYAGIQDPMPEMIIDDGDYDRLLEKVSKYDPIRVIPGHELGVVLATRLSADLGLKGNPVSLIPVMTQKDKMQLALKEAGLRYIRGKVVKSVEEAVRFYDTVKKPVVVKPCSGGGSFGVRICFTKEDAIAFGRIKWVPVTDILKC